MRERKPGSESDEIALEENADAVERLAYLIADQFVREIRLQLADEMLCHLQRFEKAGLPKIRSAGR
jgi:hypothetical protein